MLQFRRDGIDGPRQQRAEGPHVPLPERASPEIREQLDDVRQLHQEDLAPAIQGFLAWFPRATRRQASPIRWIVGRTADENLTVTLVPIWCQLLSKFFAFSFIFLPIPART